MEVHDVIRRVERERCAKVCEAVMDGLPQFYYDVVVAKKCAAAIRALTDENKA